MNSEILIIGGGIIGLTIARELHKKGASRITILERGLVGKESSYAAAGMLAPQAETDKADDFFRFCSESNKLYPQFAQELFDETDVDIELDRSGTLYLAFTDEDVKEIRKRFEWQKSAGLEVEHLTARETLQTEPFASPDVLESLFFPNDWQVENRKLLYALHKYCELYEIEIRENAEIKNLLIENKTSVSSPTVKEGLIDSSKTGKPAHTLGLQTPHTIIGAETENEQFFAEKVVLATGAWTSFIKAGAFSLPKIKPLRGQMISFYTAKRIFSKVIYSPRGYIVPRADGRVLAGATVEDAGFDKSLSAEGIDFVREHALEIAPSLVNLEIQETWAGLRPFAADGLPVLGAFSEAENLFIATAHYRNGILLAPLTGKILAEKIAENKDTDYLQIFSPERFLTNNAQALNIAV